MSERASAMNSCGAMPASSSATSKRRDVEWQSRLVEAVLQIVAKVRAHDRLAGEIHREHRVRVGPAIAIALHPHQQRADDPAIDGRHAAVALRRVEKLVRLEHAELLRGQADQHLDDERLALGRLVVAQRDDGLQVQREFIFAQRGIDQRKQMLLAAERFDIAGKTVVRRIADETQRRDDRGVGSCAFGAAALRAPALRSATGGWPWPAPATPA